MSGAPPIVHRPGNCPVFWSLSRLSHIGYKINVPFFWQNFNPIFSCSLKTLDSWNCPLLDIYHYRMTVWPLCRLTPCMLNFQKRFLNHIFLNQHPFLGILDQSSYKGLILNATVFFPNCMHPLPPPHPPPLLNSLWRVSRFFNQMSRIFWLFLEYVPGMGDQMLAGLLLSLLVAVTVLRGSVGHVDPSYDHLWRWQEGCSQVTSSVVMGYQY